jgi:hypothetical protein
MEKKNLVAELNKIAEEFKVRLQRGARLDKTVATGKFANSFNVKVKDDSIEITSDASYAGAVIEGASPARSTQGWESKKRSIESWIKAKGIRPYRKLKSGYKFAKTSTLKNSAYKSAVFAIMQSTSQRGTIKRFGYKGSNLFERVYKEIEGKIGADITEAYSEDLKIELRKVINISNE